MSFIFSNISHSFNQEFSAILQEIGYKITQDFFINNHEFIACSFVGIIFKSREVSILSFIQIGFIQIKKSIKNIKKARRKFIKIHASIIIACCQLVLFARLYDELFSSSNLSISSFSCFQIFSPDL